MAIEYITSRPGILKIVQEVFNIIAFSCVASANLNTSRAEAFLAASISAFVITLLLLIIRTFDIDNKVVLPWAKVEFIYDVAWFIFYLITSALIIDQGNIGYGITIDKFIAGGSFGLFATLLYLIDAYDKYKTGL